MAQSLARQIKRGHIKSVWNSTFHRMELFKKTNRGLFVMCNFAGKLIAFGPGVTGHSLDKSAEA